VHLSAPEHSLMIQLTRLNSQPLMVNSDLIKFVEKAPDTVLTLITGEKVIVLESADTVLEKIVAFRRSILTGPAAQSPETASDNPSAAPPPRTYPEEG
jgi:flagellar protein FlbD